MSGRIFGLLFVVMTLIGAGRCDAAALSQKELETVLGNLNASMMKIKSLECDFESESSNPMLSETIRAKGKIWLKSTGAMRMSVYDSGKESERFCYEPKTKKITIGLPGEETVIDDKTGGMVVSLMKMATGAGLANISRDYKAKASLEGNMLDLELVPLNKSLKSLCSEINLKVNLKDSLVKSVRIVSPDGGKINYVFKNVRINSSGGRRKIL